MTSITPLPWTVQRGEMCPHETYIEDGNGRLIKFSDPRVQAYIVRCCNSHPALVDACRQMRDAMKAGANAIVSGEHCEQNTYDNCLRLMEMADKALQETDK